MLKKDMARLKEKLAKEKTKENKPQDLLTEAKREREHLEKSLADINALYAITKEMSSGMRFAELFRSLKNFLEENFKFGKFTLIFLNTAEGSKAVDKIYEITKDSQDYARPSERVLDFTERISKTRKPLFLERNKDLFNHGLEEGLHNIAAIPLMIRKRLIAVTLAENIAPEDFDKYFILSSQVALQIERISLFDSIEKLSVTDGLTGVYLRRHFMERLDGELARARQHNMNLSFIMADLDFFKKCNDNYGHLVGDVVLREVANIIKHNIREIDIVGRFGGEEFSICLPEADTEGAKMVSERIRKAIEDHVIKAYDENIRITISMGISAFPADSKNKEELIENADKALYAAKKHGRNRIFVTGN